MAALLNTGPPRVTKFEGDHIPLMGVISSGVLFYPYFLRISFI